LHNLTITKSQGNGTITNDDVASLSVNDVTVTETNSGTVNAVFTVTLAGSTTAPFTVDYITSDNTATIADADYNAVTGTLNFAGTAGETQTITVAVNGDTVLEGNDIFHVNLNTLSNNFLGNLTISDPQGDGTILNDDVATLTVNDVAVVETNSGTVNAVFNVMLNGSTTSGFSIDFATSDNSATIADSDYVANSGTLSFAGTNNEVQTITVVVNGDSVVELDEAFLVDLSNLTNNFAGNLTVTKPQGNGTITNDDVATLAINDITITEGDLGTVNAVFNVALTGSTTSGFSVDYATADSSATIADSDYVAGTGTLNFTGTAGEVQTVTVVVNSDTTVELDEAFLVDISNLSSNFAGNLTIAKSQGNATITNDDVATLAINDITITETDLGTVNAVFNVVLTGSTNAGFSLDYATTDNSATIADSDYVAGTGTVNFAGTAGEVQTITIAVNGDTTVELDEAFLVDISNLTNNFAGNLTIAKAQGSATIANDDVASLSINDVIVTETNSGTVNAVFNVVLTGSTTVGFSVDYTTTDSSATLADSDYVGGTGTLNFAGTAGEVQTITVAVNGDTAVELDEAFLVDIANLSNNFAGNLTITKSQGNGTITNDDTAGLSVNDVAVTETNSGTVNAVFTVTLTGSTTAPFTVDYVTSDNTATIADADYSAVTGTLNFTGTAGETQTITVLVNGDTVLEGNDIFHVNLNTLSNNFAGNLTILDPQGDGTILNDDTATLTINDIAVVETNSGTVNAVFNVMLNGATTSGFSVDYVSADNSATIADLDYVAGSGTLNFVGTAGEIQTVSIPVNGDSIVELDELFIVDISNLSNNFAGNLTIAKSRGVATITNDDVADLSINDITITEGNTGTVNAVFNVVLNGQTATLEQLEKFKQLQL